MLTLSISNGTLSDEDGDVILSRVYAGGDHGSRPDGVNNSALCHTQDVGPIPPGMYTIGPFQVHCAEVSSPAFELIPDPENEMYGRSGFYFHDNNPRRDAGEPPYPPTPGRNSSDGCPVTIDSDGLSKIHATGDTQLTVIP